MDRAPWLWHWNFAVGMIDPLQTTLGFFDCWVVGFRVWACWAPSSCLSQREKKEKRYPAMIDSLENQQVNQILCFSKWKYGCVLVAVNENQKEHLHLGVPKKHISIIPVYISRSLQTSPACVNPSPCPTECQPLPFGLVSSALPINDYHSQVRTF